jgi:hypothetical protein
MWERWSSQLNASISYLLTFMPYSLITHGRSLQLVSRQLKDKFGCVPVFFDSTDMKDKYYKGVTSQRLCTCKTNTWLSSCQRSVQRFAQNCYFLMDGFSWSSSCVDHISTPSLFQHTEFAYCMLFWTLTSLLQQTECAFFVLYQLQPPSSSIHSVHIVCSSQLQPPSPAGFCKQLLWPLFHYILPVSPSSAGRFDLEFWQAYVKANKVCGGLVMSSSIRCEHVQKCCQQESEEIEW